MTIAYVAQQAPTGALAQAQILDEHLDDVVLVRSTSIGADDAYVPFIEGEEMVYPTSGLAPAIRALDPDVVLVHVLNDEVVRSVPEIQATHPVVMRAGLNVHETLMGGSPNVSAGLPTAVRTLQAFDHLIAPSLQAGQDLAALGVDPGNISRIPSSISLDLAEDPEFNAPIAAGCLTTRVSPLKNQHTLIVAMGALRQIDPTLTAPLLLPGAGGDLVPTLEQLADVIGLGSRVQLGMFYEDPEADFFPNIGVHLMPSFSERLPLSVLEAARAGVPSIVAEAGWAEEFESMVTAPPDDPWSWAEELALLLNNDARRVQVARNQQEEIADRFDVEDVVLDYQRLFDDVVDRVEPFKVPLSAFERGAEA